MGDYKNHKSETGRYICNSYDDVVASKRHKGDEMEEKKVRAYDSQIGPF